MGSLNLYTGNKMEDLIEALAASLRIPLRSPLTPELVLVQSKGMEHWVSLRLAHVHGICANMRFPFPNRFLEEIRERVFPGTQPTTPFDPERLHWRIMRLLPRMAHLPKFQFVRDYLENDQNGLRCYQLSERIADTFDQYSLYRPEFLLSWEKGQGDDWQAELWRRLVREMPEALHRAAAARSLIEDLQAVGSPTGLPERISVFGISSLPKFHTDVLAALATHCTVSLFLMNPCKEYWGDIVSSKESSRLKSRESSSYDDSDLYLETGNPILASTGKTGRDFFKLVTEYPAVEQEIYSDIPEESLLHCIQSDILHLRNRGTDGVKTAVEPEDLSVRIHSCHSPLREIEVLRDHLLGFFENLPEISPSDVLVTAPDIEEYAPYIRAVFDSPPSEDQYIPYSIADRSLRSESDIIDPFLRLLDLGKNRFTASSVLAVLEAPSVMRRFGFEERDLMQIRTWVLESGIRWGIDGSFRAGLGVPGFEENTWAEGLKRMSLGYAMAGRNERTFCGILPYDEIEGSGADLFERFEEFLSALFNDVPTQETDLLSPHQWALRLGEALERFFLPEPAAEKEIQAIRKTLVSLSEVEKETGFDNPLDPDVIRYFLGKDIERHGLGLGFMTGGVTFCSMLPMRSIPFQIIWCLGMNSDAFPRTHFSPEFDLMARHPRPGDRSRRFDDRYIFLETLLCARSHLHLSYMGRNNQDNTPLSPSVLVSELLDSIEQGFYIPGEKILEKLVLHHPLQSFSPSYFSGQGPLFSFNPENLEAAEALVGPRAEPLPFFSHGLDDPGAEWDHLDLNDLVHFFSNPCSYIVRKRLGINLGAKEAQTQDREPFNIQGLDRFLLGRELLTLRLKGRPPRKDFDIIKASGRLPHGTIGRTLYNDLVDEVELFAEGITTFQAGDPLEPCEFDLELGRYRIKGNLEGIHAKGMTLYRFATIKAKDRLNAWIRHLFFNCSGPLPTQDRETLLFGLPRDKRGAKGWTGLRYGPVENAPKILFTLLNIYREGLSKPLALFPETSCSYAETLLRKQGSQAEALAKAGKAWEGNPYYPGESTEPYTALCFRNQEPLGSVQFQEKALDVFAPLLENEGIVKNDT